METKKNDLPNVPDGALVTFTPRGQDVQMSGKVKGRYTSTLDGNLYLRIKAEDKRTYTKQIKNVQVLTGRPAKKSNQTDDMPESLLKEIRNFSKSAQQKTNEQEVAALVKKYFKQNMRELVKSLG